MVLMGLGVRRRLRWMGEGVPRALFKADFVLEEATGTEAAFE